MQINNKLRPFSTDTDNIIADDDLGTERVTKGAILETKADSGLYNSLSRVATLPSVALTDLIAKENPSVTFSQETPITTYIESINNTILTPSVFNTENVSKVSDYILPKKKLIFEGNLVVPSTINNIVMKEGVKYEIQYRPNSIVTTPIVTSEFILATTSMGNERDIWLYTIQPVKNASVGPLQASLIIYGGAGTYDISNNTLTIVNCYKHTITGDGDVEKYNSINFTIKKIYEIIE